VPRAGGVHCGIVEAHLRSRLCGCAKCGPAAITLLASPPHSCRVCSSLTCETVRRLRIAELQARPPRLSLPRRVQGQFRVVSTPNNSHAGSSRLSLKRRDGSTRHWCASRVTEVAGRRTATFGSCRNVFSLAAAASDRSRCDTDVMHARRRGELSRLHLWPARQRRKREEANSGM
jgi:hypothetical protein